MPFTIDLNVFVLAQINVCSGYALINNKLENVMLNEIDIESDRCRPRLNQKKMHHDCS